jgi:hypothetical protein
MSTKIMIRKSTEKRPCGRYWNSFQGDIKLDLKEM